MRWPICTSRGNGKHLPTQLGASVFYVLFCHWPWYNVFDAQSPWCCCCSSATNRLITAKDHASVQINIGHLDESGVYTGQFTTFALSGFIRAQVCLLSLRFLVSVCMLSGIICCLCDNWYGAVLLRKNVRLFVLLPTKHLCLLFAIMGTLSWLVVGSIVTLFLAFYMLCSTGKCWRIWI